MDSRDLFEFTTKQPRIFCEVKKEIGGDINILKFGITFDKRVLYFPKNTEFSTVLLSWIALHNIFDVEIEILFKGLYYFLDMVYLKIEKKSNASMHVQILAKEVNCELTKN